MTDDKARQVATKLQSQVDDHTFRRCHGSGHVLVGPNVARCECQTWIDAADLLDQLIERAEKAEAEAASLREALQKIRDVDTETNEALQSWCADIAAAAMETT